MSDFDRRFKFVFGLTKAVIAIQLALMARTPCGTCKGPHTN